MVSERFLNETVFVCVVGFILTLLASPFVAYIINHWEDMPWHQ